MRKNGKSPLGRKDYCRIYIIQIHSLNYFTIDLGIAPKKLESYQNGDIKSTDPMERLELVKGYLVSFPLDFMCKEDLRHVFNECEYYASSKSFTEF